MNCVVVACMLHNKYKTYFDDEKALIRVELSKEYIAHHFRYNRFNS